MKTTEKVFIPFLKGIKTKVSVPSLERMSAANPFLKGLKPSKYLQCVIASKTEGEELKERSAEVVDIVRQCYIHSHTKTCKKNSSECRFHFAKFPMWRKILTRPMKDRGEDHEAVKQNTAAS